MNSAIVYFGNYTHSEELDDRTRERVVDDGVRLLSDVPGVEIESRLPFACAVILRLSDTAVRRVQDLLAKNKAGTLTLDEPSRPVFRAAR